MTRPIRLRYQRNAGRACLVEGCGNPAYAKGRCEPCYRYWRRHGVDRHGGMLLQHGDRWARDRTG